MGADGGTIPRRDELVTVKKKAVKRDPQIDLDAKWKFCALSATELQEPIYACELGMLFNKEAVIRGLIAAKEDGIKPPVIKHIKSLKDLHQLNLKHIGAASSKRSKYMCPVAGIAMNGLHRFVYSINCGCVVSEKALRETPSSSCLVCGTPYTKEDIIVINPPFEEMKQQGEAIKARRAAKKAAKANAADGEDAEAKAKRKAAKRAAKQAAAQAAAAAKKPTIKKVLMGADEELAWAMSDKPVEEKDSGSATYKSLFHSSKEDKDDGHTYTARLGFTKAYKWG